MYMQYYNLIKSNLGYDICFNLYIVILYDNNTQYNRIAYNI